MTDETRRNIAVLIADEDADARRRAAEDLASETGLAPIAALAAALQDESKGVRDTACRSLLAIGGGQAARAIVEYICSKNIVTRNLASDLLIKNGETGIPALLPYLHDPDQDVRKAVVDVLGLIGGPVPIERILPLLNDVDTNVVISAAEALGNIGRSDALEELERTFDRCDYARPVVAEALGKIGDVRSARFLMDRLTRALGHMEDDPLTLLGLIEAVGRVGDPASLKVLGEYLPRLAEGLRPGAIHAVVQIASRTGGAFPACAGLQKSLLDALENGEGPQRVSAATWLQGLPDQAVTRALVNAFGLDAELDAVLGPGLQDRAEALAFLVQSIETDTGARARAKAALLSQLVLRRIHQMMRATTSAEDDRLVGSAFDAVAHMWERADQDSRSSIVDAMFRLDGDRAVQFLDTILEQPDPWLRMHVIELIAAIADKRAPEYIARFLNDEDETVRALAQGLLEGKGYVPHES
ncbi:MAG TPA: HEAT repeat domain-containing protein [Bacteroidota bacterium]|nr:HEAT repeat domain-containing protein [Bacteroidota bacterium]